jgi:hypothetical protein
MLVKCHDLIDISLKRGPYFIVGEMHKDKTISYIKHLAINCYPSFPDDEILEQTPDIWEAQLFCRELDALAVLKERCGFGCNCGIHDSIGKIWKVTRSGREKEGITYGYCDCSRPDYHKERFETIYDVKEIYTYTQKTGKLNEL